MKSFVEIKNLLKDKYYESICEVKNKYCPQTFLD